MRLLPVPVLVLASVLPATAQEPPPAGAQATAQPCPVSIDPEFGRTPARAIRVGGGAAYVAARERRYLEALRGPGGEPVTLGGRSSMRESPDGGILDHWLVRWEGLAEPVSLYLDAYHYADPVAPAGFTCTGFRLGPPPVDPFLAQDLQLRLAVEQGVERTFDPVPLAQGPQAAHGVYLDRFRMAAAAARAAAASGTPLDPAKLPRDIQFMGVAIVAQPIACADRTVAPESVEVITQQGQPVKLRAGPVSGDELAALVPGYAAPDGSIGVVVDLPGLRPTDSVRLTYAGELCYSPSREVSLPSPRVTRAQPKDLPRPTFPEGVEPTDEPVWLQVVVDVDGRFQQPRYIGGPERLLDAALAAIREWRAEPARANGVPVVADTLLLVRFR